MRNVLGSLVIKKKDNYDLRFKFVLKSFIAVANNDKIVNDNNDIRHCNIHWHKHSVDPKNDIRIIVQKVLNYEGSFLFVRPPRQYVMHPQLQNRCHYKVYQYVKIWLVRWGMQILCAH